MSRYIDVEGFEKLFDKEYKATRELINQGETHLDNIAEGFTEATKVIRSIPTADAVEVRHGKWLKSSPYNRFMNCSVCGFGQNHKSFPYCPMCGAEMSGKRSANDGT